MKAESRKRMLESPKLTAYSLQLKASQRAFALLITLVLLAFLVLLVVGLATFTKVETQISDNTGKQAQARRNALMALNIAIGRLQQYAGQDQAITARADITSAAPWSAPSPGHVAQDINNPFRTGVWPVQADGTLGNPVWLVSGNIADTGNPDPVTPTAPRLDPNAFGTGEYATRKINEQLVGANTAWPYTTGSNTAPTSTDQAVFDVVVRKEFIKAPQEAVAGMLGSSPVIGSFAYWISDEGLKGSFGLTNKLAEISYSPYDVSTQQQRLQQLLASGIYRNLYVNGFPLLSDMTKLFNLDQIQLYNAALLQGGLYDRQVRKLFHSITVLSRGVLASPLPQNLNGGLRQDLSLAPEALPPNLSGMQDYLQVTATGSAAPSDLWREYKITAPPTLNPTTATAVFSIAPVLTEFGLQLGFTVPNGTSIQAHVRTRVELWNPYSSSLAADQNLQIVISGLPTITIAGASPSSIDLQSALGSLIINLSAPTPRWLPGRFTNWSGDLNPTIDDLNETSLTYVASTGATLPTSVSQIALSVAANANLTLTLQTASGLPLATYSGFSFASVTSGKVVAYAKAGTSMKIGYHIRLKERTDDPVNWLTGTDPRSVSSSVGSYVVDSAPENSAGTLIASSGYLFARAASDKSYNNDVPLFELPRQAVISLGEFQHVQIAGRPPFYFGSSAASVDGFNQLFDRFFFSGVSAIGAGPNLPADPVPNLRLEVVSSLEGSPTLSSFRSAGGDSARFFLVRGAFNINSTAKEAWEAILGGARISDWTYLNLDSGTGLPTGATSTTDTQPAFWRFPQSAQETFRATQTPTSYYRQGVRSLTSDQLSALAEQIINQIKLKGGRSGPFRSIDEFLSPNGGTSVLDAAITASGINTGMDAYSSQYVTQADIISAIAPFINVRSDTFLIRTFGESINPTTGNSTGQAWCEAVVQRLPDPVQTSDGGAPSTEDYRHPQGTFGRKFKLIYFRWLGPNDI